MGTPQLNIKDAEATRLVQELAELTGETQTVAMRKALRERLEREKAERARPRHATPRGEEERRREFDEVWRKIRKIQESVRRRGFAEHMLTDDDLYDENGLPK
jgi:antitoxin VapB